ncbi:hypothetical protein FOMPIDRAFT_1047447 [Fomitopsis schrenkii]|uniref:Uncharacterized protein n=1 Tax=Fomitopsis schrenkii TaxID=2126942 RepID=S8EHJ4_FOMSC|nr:hypothetical protein FOMPIDRAFT_1047447 [Fomitopsis schrenkii]
MRRALRATPLPRTLHFTKNKDDGASETAAPGSRLSSVAPSAVRLRLASLAPENETLLEKVQSGGPPMPPPAPQRTSTTPNPRPTLYTLTRRPRAGWRDIAHSSFTSRNEGQCPRQAAAWENDPHDIALLRFPGHGAQDPGTEDQIAEAQLVLRNNWGVEVSLLDFIPAIPATPGELALNEGPYDIAVIGLTSDLIDMLDAEGWISAPSVTFRIEHLRALPPRFQGAFRHPRHFGNVSPEGIAARIRATLRDGGANEATIRHIISNDIADEGRWSHLDEDTVFEYIVSSVRARVIPYQVRGGASEPLVLIYIESPTADEEEWETFRTFVMSRTYGDDLTGHPTPFTGRLWCALCHSHDHPTGLCDLPTVAGWNGPNLDYYTLRGSAARQQDRRAGGKANGKRPDYGRDNGSNEHDKRRRDFDGRGRRGGGLSSRGSGGSSMRH